MQQDDNTKNLEKEAAERKRLFDEMMASVNKQSEKWGPEGRAKERERLQEELELEQSGGLLGIFVTFIIFVFGIFLIGKGHIIIGIVVLVIGGFSLLLSLGSSSLVKEDQLNQMQYGYLNAAMICPHCQKKGKIYTQMISSKKGISGGKATAALLTGGWSMLATGLSRKESGTQAHCTNCNNTWVL